MDTPLTLPPNADFCDECGTIFYVSEWPICGGDPSKHQPIETLPASVGSPTVIYQNDKGQVDYVLRDGAPLPGFTKRIELSNQRERDRFEKESNARAIDRGEREKRPSDYYERKIKSATVDEMRAWKDTLKTTVARDAMDGFITRALGHQKRRTQKKGDGNVYIDVNHNYQRKKEKS